MKSWWTDIGEPSLVAGVVIGVAWGALSTMRRRRRFVVRGLHPTHQVRWFLCAAFGMGGYMTLLAVVGLLAIYDQLPQFGVYFVLTAASLSYTLGLLHGRFEEPALLREPAEAEVAPASPPPKRRPRPISTQVTTQAALPVTSQAIGSTARNGHDGEPASPAA